MTTLEQVVLDAVEQLYGVKVEPHQIIAIGRARERVRVFIGSDLRMSRGIRSTDPLPWAEILRQAYEQTKGRRRSRAERGGYACSKVTDRSYPGMPNEWMRRCCRPEEHEGKCSPGVTRYPPATGAVGRK